MEPHMRVPPKGTVRKSEQGQSFARSAIASKLDLAGAVLLAVGCGLAAWGSHLITLALGRYTRTVALKIHFPNGNGVGTWTTENDSVRHVLVFAAQWGRVCVPVFGLGAAALLARMRLIRYPKVLFVIAVCVEGLGAVLSAVVLVSLFWFSVAFVDCFSSCSPPAPSQFLWPAFFIFILTGVAASVAITTTVLASSSPSSRNPGQTDAVQWP